MRLRDEIKPNTLALYESQLRLHLTSKFGETPVEAVDPGEVEMHLTRLGARSKRNANQLRQRIDALWRHARKVHKLAVTSPAEDWELLEETERDRVLDDDEIRLFWRGLDNPDLAPSPQCGIALKLCLILAQRNTEISGMRDDEFDLEARTWTVPATRVKARKKKACVNVVALPPQAVTLIRKALALRGMREAPGPVFPSSIDANKPMSAQVLAKAMSRFCRRIKLSRATPHDLRGSWRTIATQERCNVPRDIAELVLSHSIADQTERRYDRNAYLSERCKALETVANVLDEIIRGPLGENVVPIGARP